MAKRKVSLKQKGYKESLVPKGRLLAIGGHEDKGRNELKEEQVRNAGFQSQQILRFFVEELRGDDPTVVVVTTASTVPEEVAAEYLKALRELGVNNVEVLDIRSRKQAMDEAHLEVVERAAGIFFTGGSQLRLSSIFGGTKVLQLMQKRYTYDEDILIAGTSAGATAMSTSMIYEGETHGGYMKGDVRITTGLEFMKNVAVDTHFIKRGRFVRMAQCIVTNPGCIGIGLEEDTAVYVTEGKELLVVGSGLLTVVDGTGITATNIYEIKTGEPFAAQGLRMHLLSSGERYTLPVYDMLHQ